MLSLSSILLFAGIGVSAAACSKCPVANIEPLAMTGEPVGKEIVQDNITTYITGQPTDTAILYLTDVFGINLTENKLLADSFGRAGWLTVAPDMFMGEPAPADLDQPGWDVDAFLAAHQPNVTDPLIESTIAYMRSELGVKKIITTGYCFGGRYVFRFLAEGRGVDVGFTAHPSEETLAEILAITGPASVATAENDEYTSTEKRHKMESVLRNTTQPYSMALYGGTVHGFAVRPDMNDPKQVFAKEEAFVQAVRWFDYWA